MYEKSMNRIIAEVFLQFAGKHKQIYTHNLKTTTTKGEKKKKSKTVEKRKTKQKNFVFPPTSKTTTAVNIVIAANLC